MKRVVLGLLLASIAGAAGAADMSARPAYTKAPMMSPAINWTGFYIGAMGGYAAEAANDSLAIKGGFAGGTLGYNLQSGMLVLGIEADGAWADISRSASAAGSCHPDGQGPELRHCTRPGRHGVQPDPALRNRRCGL